jgi:hypothetical protein
MMRDIDKWAAGAAWKDEWRKVWYRGTWVMM